MTNQGMCLAGKEGFGQIYDCGSCGNIHVQVGPVTVTLDAGAYMQFVELVHTSAANFEVWLQIRNGKGPAGWTDDAGEKDECKQDECKEKETL
jgi:hypothetical protein